MSVPVWPETGLHIHWDAHVYACTYSIRCVCVCAYVGECVVDSPNVVSSCGVWMLVCKSVQVRACMCVCVDHVAVVFVYTSLLEA